MNNNDFKKKYKWEYNMWNGRNINQERRITKKKNKKKK